MDEKRIISEYKKTFDNICASEELKLKVLAQKPQKHRIRNIKPIIGVATSVAAAVMIFTAVGDYSFNNDNNGVIDETVIMQTQKPNAVKDSGKSTESVPQVTESVQITYVPTATAKPVSKSENNSYSDKTEQSKASKAPAVKNNATENRTQSSQQQIQKPKAQQYIAAEQETALPQSDDIVLDSEEHTPEPAGHKPVQAAESNTYAAASSEMEAANDINSLSVDDGGESILKINDKQLFAKENSVLRGSGSSSYSSVDGYYEEEWDNDRYFNYIGLNVTDKISLASDFSYTGADLSYVMVNSDGELYDDKRIFEFNGADGRYVSVITSRNTTEAESYISNPSLEISEISGCKAVVFMFGDTYKCYMTFNGTSCIVEAKGITETEMGEVLLSLTR